MEEWELAADDDDDVAEEPTKTRARATRGPPRGRSRARTVSGRRHPADVLAQGRQGVEPVDGRVFRTIGDGGYGLCAALLPGGRHAVVGTKTGALEIVDVQAGVQLTGMPGRARRRRVGRGSASEWFRVRVTASADKTVKFFEWRLGWTSRTTRTTGGEGRRGELTVAHVKTLQMAEDVLSVNHPGREAAVGVAAGQHPEGVLCRLAQVFLSLYGHRLPALCHDVSSDSQLLASGGADKNIRSGVSISATVTGRCLPTRTIPSPPIAFVPKTHYLFSTGKDRQVKYWDADKFEPLLTLQGHHASAWCVALSRAASSPSPAVTIARFACGNERTNPSS